SRCSMPRSLTSSGASCSRSLRWAGTASRRKRRDPALRPGSPGPCPRTCQRRGRHLQKGTPSMNRKQQPEPVDVVIVGAGAGGATAAKVLSEAGLKVVGLERGPWLKPEHASGDELKFLNR